MIRPAVLVDGAVAGTWSLDRARDHVAIRAFGPVGRTRRTQLDREVTDLGRFLDRDLSWTLDPA
jgi:hypothetical protein